MFGSAVMALLGALVGACAAAGFPTEHAKFRPRARVVLTWMSILGMPLTHRSARWDFDELEEAALDDSGMLWIREEGEAAHPVGRGVTRLDVEDLNRALGAGG